MDKKSILPAGVCILIRMCIPMLLAAQESAAFKRYQIASFMPERGGSADTFTGPKIRTLSHELSEVQFTDSNDNFHSKTVKK